MNIAAIIKTMVETGAHLPAYKQLLDQVMGLFGEHDQAELKQAYEQALARADEAHTRAQQL